MILTSSGEVLTNNHVIEGATSIRVTIPSSNRSYSADVVGADPTHDVALIQLVGASGLTPVTVGASSVSGWVSSSWRSATRSGAAGPFDQYGHGRCARPDHHRGWRDRRELPRRDPMNAISPGESGGPIADRAGQVVGMITAGQPSDGSTTTRRASRSPRTRP
jgi:S1-C subfamily serine protease